MDGTLSWTTRDDAGPGHDGETGPEAPAGFRVAIEGAITELSDFEGLTRALAPHAVVTLDLAGVEHVNSYGVSRWVKFIQALTSPPRRVTLERCSPAMVRQFGMVAGSTGAARVGSVLVPYVCELCGIEETRPLSLVRGQTPAPEAHAPCSTCGEPMDFDDLADVYFAFATP